MGLFSNLLPAVLNPFAAIGAATTFGGDYLLNQNQNQANKAMWNVQRDQQINMWHLQNEYNTPSAQVQRLRDAGLNPNLAYGQVADSKAAQVGVPNVPTMNRPAAPRLAEYQQVVNMQEQNSLIRTQKAEVEQRAIGQALDNQYKDYENNKLMGAGMLKSDSGNIAGLMKWLFRGAAGTPDRPGVLRRDFQDR